MVKNDMGPVQGWHPAKRQHPSIVHILSAVTWLRYFGIKNYSHEVSEYHPE